MIKETGRTFLYTQKGVNDELNCVAREELTRRGAHFQEIDLTGFRLDEEWPSLPVISSREGFVGGFRNAEAVRSRVAFNNPQEPQT